MASRGPHIMQGAREALSFAAGDSEGLGFKVQVSSEIDVKGIRSHLGMTQAVFAETFGLSVVTVKAWELGTSVPDEAGRAYLKVIQLRPEAVREALAL